MNSIAFILTSLLCIPIVVIAESLLLPKNSIQLAKSIFACKLNVHEELNIVIPIHHKIMVVYVPIKMPLWNSLVVMLIPKKIHMKQ